LETISHAQGAGISVCSGGIIGLGETNEDRVGMLHTLSTLQQHPESVPINALLAVEGTPLEKQEVSNNARNESRVFSHLSERVYFILTCMSLLLPQPVSIFEMIRMVATARIVMPKSMVRLSAGRVRFSQSEQAMCFLAGANSIFTGDKLLTTPNNEFTDDQKMFELLGKFLPCLKSPF
jgi:biotin synthase